MRNEKNRTMETYSGENLGQDKKNEDKSKVLTVLHSKNISLTKIHDLDARKTESYGRAKMFRLERIPIATMEGLYDFLYNLSFQATACVVNGEPISIWGSENTRDNSTLKQRDVTFLPLDIDGVDIGEFNPNQCDIGSIVKQVLRAIGLEWMSEYTYVWAWTSSVGAPHWKRDARLRLWFQLDVPVHLKALKVWAKPIHGLDSSIYSPCQVIYTANPIFKRGSIKINDPIHERLGLVSGSFGDEIPSQKILPEKFESSYSLPDEDNKPNNFDRVSVLHSVTRGTIEDLKSALEVINSDEYNQWCRIGLALASMKNTDFEELALELWLEYSSKSNAYSEEQTLSKWESFNPCQIDFRAVFNEARELGWEPSKAKKNTHTSVLERFHLKPDGVYFNNINKSGSVTPQKICAPLFVLAKTRNHSGNDWGRLLEWGDADSNDHRWAMPAELLHGDYSELAKCLASKGLDILPGTAKKVAEYIAYVPTEKRAGCVDRLGWAKNSFVLPDKTIGEDEENIVYQSEAVADHQIKQKGSIENWKESISLLSEGNSRLVLALASAFAAPTLRLVGAEGGGFHLYGGSSTGKSTAQRVAASVWGNSDYVRRWRATSNGLEGVAAAHNDLQLILDELSELEPRYTGEVAYMLANGQGKQRASKSGMGKKPLRWLTLFLSSGEITLADHIRKAGDKVNAGQAVRCIDIPADAGVGLGLFNTLHHFKSPQSFVNHLKSATGENHGFVGLIWLEYLTKNKESATKRLEELQEEFKKVALPGNPESQVLRALDRFALCAAAGELATEQGLTGWCKGECFNALKKCFTSWVSVRGGTGNLEEANLCSQVREFFTNHAETRFTDTDYPSSGTINRVGFKAKKSFNNDFRFKNEREEELYEYYVLPEGFKQITQGFEAKWAKQVLLKKGWLKLEKNGESARKTLPGVGRIRCYIFTHKVFD